MTVLPETDPYRQSVSGVRNQALAYRGEASTLDGLSEVRNVRKESSIPVWRAKPKGLQPTSRCV